MARKPDSIDSRIAKGNINRKDRVPRDREKGIRGSLSVKAPRRPVDLPEDAIPVWDRTVRLLKTMGVITQGDEAIIYGFSVAYTRWRAAELEVSKNGTFIKAGNGSGEVQNPNINLAKGYLRQVIILAKELGFTPGSREKLSLRVKEEPKKAVGRYIHE